MSQQPEFRISAKLVRKEARAKLKQLRQDRILRKQYPKEHTANDTSMLETDLVAVSDAPEISILTDPVEDDASALTIASAPDVPRIHDSKHASPEGSGDDDHTVEAVSINEPAFDSFQSPELRPNTDPAEMRALAEMDAINNSLTSQTDTLSPEIEPSASYGDEQPCKSKENAEPTPCDPSETLKKYMEKNQTLTPKSCAFRSQRADTLISEIAVSPKPFRNRTLEEKLDNQPPEDLPISRLQGVGPGLVWLLKGCGIRNLTELANANPEQIEQELGLVGQILDVRMLMQLAKSEHNKAVNSAHKTPAHDRADVLREV